MNHPMQPIYEDSNGHLRFQGNAIVQKLLEVSRQAGVGLNELAVMGFSREDHVQFAQLIGYSLSGFSELSYVSNEEYAAAEIMAEEGKSELEARVEHLQGELDSLRQQLLEPIARLYGRHPDDLLSR